MAKYDGETHGKSWNMRLTPKCETHSARKKRFSGTHRNGLGKAIMENDLTIGMRQTGWELKRLARARAMILSSPG